jgi:hypothetical protein
VTGLLFPSLVAAIAGLALRGKCTRFEGLRFRWWEVVVIAFGIELALYNPPIDSMPLAVTYGPWLWVATRIALLLTVARNAHTNATWSVPCLVLALGIGLNTIVIVANGGYMPQSITAATAVWGPDAASPAVDPVRLQNTRPMNADSQLTWLGDVLAEPTWIPRPNVLSIGDVLLAMGMAGWIFTNLRGGQTTGDGGDASSVADVEFREDMLHVRFDGLHRDNQVVGNRPI